MSQTNPTPVDALPTAPSTSAPSTFAALADAFIAALATFRTQVNAIATNVYNNAVDAYNNAVAAAASAGASAASSGVAKWVSGTSYTEGDGVWSPITFQSYRRKVTGAGTTDPSADTTNWALIGAIGTAGANLTGGLNEARGNIAMHATTMDLFALTSPNVLDGTGSPVTITAIVAAPQAGARRVLYPIAGSIITNGATFAVDGAANHTAAAGDKWEFEAITTSTFKVHVTKKDGTAIVVATPPETGTQASTFTFSGSGGTTGSVTMTYQKIGNFVTLNIPITLGTTGTGSAYMTGNTALPVAIRPAAEKVQAFEITENNGSLTAVGKVAVSAAGTVYIYRGGNESDAWGNGVANSGVGKAQTFTYFIG